MSEHQTTTGSGREAQVEALLEPILVELDLELHDLEIVSGGTVRVVVDRAAATGPGTGVTVGELARVNRDLLGALEVAGTLPNWALEVSSPGVERDLKRLRHWERLETGVRVRVVLFDAGDHGQVLEGAFVGVDGSTVRLELDGGESVAVPQEAIRRARTVFEVKKGEKRAPSRARRTRD